ncbi:MAG: hypothetical protein CMQ40_01780 [Gammaproteobacteria bacterium]|nr:hypothetical protein [Gammaproteobacteria bacterium]
MSGRSSRIKGAVGERKTAKELDERCPDHIKVKRGIGQARAGNEVPDVDGIDCLWPEVKTQKRANMRGAYRQAEEAAPPGRIPLAIIRDTGKTPLVVMSWKDWLDLWQEYWETRQL